MSDATIRMGNLPDGTLDMAATAVGILGGLLPIGSAMMSASYDQATHRAVIPTDQEGLDRLAVCIDDTREELRAAIGAIGGLMAACDATPLDGGLVVGVGFLLRALSGLDHEMKDAEDMVRETRESLREKAAAANDAESLRDAGAMAFGAALLDIRAMVRNSTKERGAWSPKEAGAFLLARMLQGEAHFTAGFAAALGCWLGYQLGEGTYLDEDTFDPVSDIYELEFALEEGVGKSVPSPAAHQTVEMQP